MRRAPARQIARDYGIATSSALRIDRWVLSEEMPEPCMDNVEGIIIDEKYLGHTFGFVTLVLNAGTGEPLFLGWVGMEDVSESSSPPSHQSKEKASSIWG